MIKTDSIGIELWNRTFDYDIIHTGPGSSLDEGHSVYQTTDSGYIIMGTTFYGDNFANIWLIKTDSSGNRVWDKVFAGPNNDYGNSIQQASDGGYIIEGSTILGSKNYIWLIKTDSSGNKVWDKTLNGFNGGDGFIGDTGDTSVQQVSDGGYIVAGEILASPFIDATLIKTNSLGEMFLAEDLWHNGYGEYQIGTANE